MEKIKDFLFDISDLFFSLLIIGIIFFVVSWKLTDTMSVTWFSNIDKSGLDGLEFTEVTTPDDEPIIIPDEPIVEEEDDEPVEEPVVEEPVEEIREVAFTISFGDTGYKIGEKLVAEGLIESNDAFQAKLAEMELANKLQADTFTLNTGMTMEEIILKLARKD